MPDSRMHLFSGGPEAIGAAGALFNLKQNKPSAENTIIYFECEDAAIESGRVAESGGRLLFPKMSMGEFGFISQCIDTEGNRIGFHSPK